MQREEWKERALQNVMYSNSRERKVEEETSSRLFSGKPDEKSQLRIEMGEKRRPRPARCETNGVDAESNERRFRSPRTCGAVLGTRGAELSSYNSGVWIGSSRCRNSWRKAMNTE